MKECKVCQSSFMDSDTLYIGETLPLRDRDRVYGYAIFTEPTCGRCLHGFRCSIMDYNSKMEDEISLEKKKGYKRSDELYTTTSQII